MVVDRINKVVLSSHNLLATLAQLHSTLCKTEFGNKIVPVYKKHRWPCLPPPFRATAGWYTIFSDYHRSHFLRLIGILNLFQTYIERWSLKTGARCFKPCTWGDQRFQLETNGCRVFFPVFMAIKKLYHDEQLGPAPHKSDTHAFKFNQRSLSQHWSRRLRVYERNEIRTKSVFNVVNGRSTNWFLYLLTPLHVLFQQALCFY